MKATVLWIDDRTNKYEGQLLSEEGKKYYFNYSTSIGKPSRGQWVKFKIDLKLQCVVVTELLNLKFKGEV